MAMLSPAAEKEIARLAVTLHVERKLLAAEETSGGTQGRAAARATRSRIGQAERQLAQLIDNAEEAPK